MSKAVIKVENLSKRYRIGLKEKQSETLAGQIGNLIKSPWQNLKRLRELSRFGVEDESVFWALKDINFEVKEGEVLGIIGKNGAGKSTLLKILSQITDPTSGKIEIEGRVASLLEVGTGFHPELSGRENIYMNGTILGMTRREIDYKLDEIINFSGVEKFVDTPVKFYSSGMKVRLGFSVAAHLEPEILIIDEVLAVGDLEFQEKCIGKMEDVAGQGRTVLFVSHSLGSIKKLCSKAMLLNNGMVQSIDDVDLVMYQYQDSFKQTDSFIFNRVVDSDAYISSIYLCDINSRNVSRFRHNEFIYIKIKLFFKFNIKLSFLLTILDSESNRVSSCERIIDGEDEICLEVGDNFLTRGRYSLQAILYIPGVQQYDILKGVCSFYVEDAGSHFTHLNNFDYGSVFGKFRWINYV